MSSPKQVWRGLTLLFFLGFQHSAIASSIKDLVQQRIDDYRQAFPEIAFITINNSKEFAAYQPLTNSLGPDSSNVDYQHPTTLRTNLLEVQEYRISVMLANDMASATLFRTPYSVMNDQPYTCLITLPQQHVFSDALQASAYMYELDGETIKNLSKEKLFDSQQLLFYAIDHEVFHCVDAYLNGALYPQTNSNLQAALDRFHAETRAEIFSVLAHIGRFPEETSFVSNLITARQINLLSFDIEHDTSWLLDEIAQQVNEQPPLDLRTLAAWAKRIAENHKSGYDDFSSRIAGLSVALGVFGIDTSGFLSEYADLDLTSISEKQVIAYTKAIKEALSTLEIQQ